MAYPTKIATCCHCGSKTTLRLDKTRHQLACASCGAPLRNLKLVPVAAPRRPAVTHQTPLRHFAKQTKAPERPKRKAKKRKGWFGARFKDMAEDLFDVVEDIFD